MSRARRALALASLLTAVAAAGCGGGSDDGGGAAQVLKPGGQISMKSLKFHPEHVQVTVGQRVAWVNAESVPHDVKADDGADFASKPFGKGGAYTWVPPKAGTVKYECTLHPGMTGTLDVVAR